MKDIATVLNKTSADTLVSEFTKAEKDLPHLAAAIKAMSLLLCSESLGGGSGKTRGPLIADLGASTAHLVIHAASEAVSDKELGKSLAARLNVSWAYQGLKESLRERKDYKDSLKIDASKF
ncbi:MAG TPA: hypothetical protein VJ875_27005 [Pyrinomonadaceae bacterium]|nr:hypothetical protein [Pyrinomonadaceae bacterium]